ncbi:MAG TPA: citrate/2-methylcitrate synthase [Syntrophomonadaceae bacterium]|nr:citrate/2-methylcitrate synthase [Syntrophomonadaceae bacterium]
MEKKIIDHFEEQIFSSLVSKAEGVSEIDANYYNKYIVKRGLRDIDGRGVLVGLTNIGEVHAYIIDEDEIIPVPGRLLYRGIDVYDIVNGFLEDNRFGYEETCYLLLFGELPADAELAAFKALASKHQKLPDFFVRDMILESPSKDIMNVLARSVLALYSYDDRADDISVANVLRQCLQLIAWLPSLAVYGYQAYSHYHGNNSLVLHSPQPDLSIAENILYMLRRDSIYSELEARTLDLALVLHAEHGGGNNSSFVTHVLTSSGTDTYSVMAAALGSLKGPRHGGANAKVVHMFEDIKKNVRDWDDEEEIAGYLIRIIKGEVFDRQGLIYGVGHAVYSISDPRAVILRGHAEGLAREKGLENEYRLYANVEKLAPQVIGALREIYKGVSVNVDFYSGLIYSMLDIPLELYTPLFAVARIAGWSAHRIEEIVNAGKIMRPAYKSVAKRREYVPLKQR